jgi:uncharacterized protein (TIGR03382 family)
MKLSTSLLALGSVALLTLSATSAQALNIGLFGTNSSANITTFLTNNGHTVTASPGSLVGFDAVILLRTTGNATIQNFVLNGGLLITEWDAADWALDTANLLNADDDGGGFIGTGTQVTFTAAGLSQGLGTGLSNPYSDGVRTEFFRTFSSIGGGVDILATRPGNIPAILGGASGAGRTVIVGYDWADSFPATLSNNGQLILNILNSRGGGNNAAPEPGTIGLATMGLLALGAVLRRRK